jgi:hypothetical protein
MTNVFGGLSRAGNTLFPTVSAGGVIAGTAGSFIVDDAPLTTSTLPEDASDRVVPETVIAGAPGASVWPETTKVGLGLGLFGLLKLPEVS